MSSSSEMSSFDALTYNRLSETMSYFHTMLRSNWNEVYVGTEPGTTSPSPSRLIKLGLHFCDHLDGHTNIEETYWFPILGKRMKAFQQGGMADTQHEAIHKGLDALTKYLKECQRGKRELRREELRGIMDGFGEGLFKHLDDEVRELGGENLRRYWSAEEVRAFPFFR